MNLDWFGPVAEGIWSIIQHWSIVICFAGVGYLLFAAWSHRAGMVLRATAMLTIGILGAFL